MAPSETAVPIAARPATPAPTTRTLAGRDLAGGGHLAGEEAAEVVAGLDHRAVAGDVRHRGERVHLLGAADARDHVHRDGGDVLRLQLLEQLGVLARVEEGDDDLAGARQRDLGGLGRADLGDDVGLRPEVGGGRDDGRRRPRGRRRRRSGRRRRRRPRSGSRSRASAAPGRTAASARPASRPRTSPSGLRSSRAVPPPRRAAAGPPACCAASARLRYRERWSQTLPSPCRRPGGGGVARVRFGLSF